MQSDIAQNRSSYLTLTVLFALSLLAHLIILVVLAVFTGGNDRVQESEAPVLTVELSAPQKPDASKPAPSEPEPPSTQAKPQQKQPEQASHLPRHNAEETDLGGTDFDAPVREKPPQGDDSKKAPSIDKQDKKTQLARGQPEKREKRNESEQQTKITPTTAETSSEPVASQIAEPEKKPSQIPEPTDKPFPEGMDAMSEKELGGAKVGKPFSEIEARRIRMVNRYLERMQRQVKSHFRPPVNMRGRGEGVVVFELGPSGYLTFSRLARSSGNPLLDASALEAVRSVPRFDVPESAAIAARYYRNLRFRFSADSQ